MKDILGEIRSPVEHVNAYFEHHAMFEVSNLMSSDIIRKLATALVISSYFIGEELPWRS